MHGQRKSRELALQTLFAWDAHGERDDNVANQIVSEGAADDGTMRERGRDFAIGAWKLERCRISGSSAWPRSGRRDVSRASIGTLFVSRFSKSPAARRPPKVAIDEAIELAKTFSTENSPAFVNGVFDAVLKEHEARTGKSEIGNPPPQAGEANPKSE